MPPLTEDDVFDKMIGLVRQYEGARESLKKQLAEVEVARATLVKKEGTLATLKHEVEDCRRRIQEVAKRL